MCIIVSSRKLTKREQISKELMIEVVGMWISPEYIYLLMEKALDKAILTEMDVVAKCHTPNDL